MGGDEVWGWICWRSVLVLVKFFRTPITVIKPPAAPWLLATGSCCGCGA